MGDSTSDAQPKGGYYVTASDGEKEWLLLGPFDSPDEATEHVAPAWIKAQEIDPRAFLWSVRAARLNDPESWRPGSLNDAFGL